MQVSQTNNKAVFVIGENKTPLTADNVTVKGGDDSRYVGNWNWTAPNETNIKSTAVNFLPFAGCKTTGTNGAPSFMNLTITGATPNSISFVVSSGQCANGKPGSASYTVNTIGSNTIYGTWKIVSHEYEYGSSSNSISKPYDEQDIPFTGNYNRGTYNGLMQVSQTNNKAVFVIGENKTPFTADNVL